MTSIGYIVTVGKIKNILLHDIEIIKELNDN